MPLLEIAVILVIIYAVAVVSIGRGGELAPARVDQAGPDAGASPAQETALAGLPSPVRPEDVDALELDLAVRGYRMRQVDAVLDRLAGELRARDARIAELEQRLAIEPAADEPGE